MPHALRFIVLSAALLTQSIAFGIAGSSKIASPGGKAHVSSAYPEGAGDVINHPSRGEGWNDWFSEWPNDVNHYLFPLKTTDELNAVIEQFAKIQSDHLEIHLAPLAEPRGLGWTTSLKEGNNAAAVFSLGDQAILDDWYKRLDGKKFGVMEFTAKPTAAPPTLTIFIDNKAVQLTALKIPPQIKVTSGYMPTISRMPTTLDAIKQDAAKAPPAKREPVDPKLEAATLRIETYLKTRTNPAAPHK
jgi:hypothetical protein